MTALTSKTKVRIPRGWNLGKVKPKRRGIYLTSRIEIAHFGHSFSRWTGTRWLPYHEKGHECPYGDYSGAPGFIWAARSTGLPTERLV